jgi:hypothetical protein
MRNVDAMANRVARKMTAETASDESLRHVDEAVDSIILGIMKLEKNLPKISPETVRQKAALDTVKELMDGAVKPYFADAVKALQAFDE